MITLNILLVDDDTDWAEIVSGRISRLGHKVKICSSVASALETMTMYFFDIIFCDMKMPYINSENVLRDDGGLYLSNIARKTSSASAIVVVTGYGGMDVAINAFREGVFDYIEKGENFFVQMADVISKYILFKKDQLLNASSEFGKKSVSDSSLLYDQFALLKVGIQGDWSVSRFIHFFLCVRNLYIISLVYLDLPAYNLLESDYIDKLVLAIRAGLLENNSIEIKVTKIVYNSPGEINFKGIGEAVREVRGFIVDLLMLKATRTSKELENDLKREQIRKLSLENDFKEKKNEIDLVAKRVDLSEKITKIMTKRGFPGDDIDKLRSLIFDERRQIEKLIESNHLQDVEVICPDDTV